MLAIRLRALVVLLVGCWLVPAAGFAADDPPAPRKLCTITDPRLGELSGLASNGKRWVAVNDGGDSVQIFVLNRDCTVLRTIDAPLDPFDVEDLAFGPDGDIWLSDTGDNNHDRDTVAVTRVTPSGETTLYRLTYPRGPRDAEALLLDHHGVPYIVTKELTGVAEVYRPAGELRSPGPTPLKQVASVRLRPTQTPGGPVSGFIGSAVVTGGSVSRSGNVVALRPYTEAYLYRAPGGDIPAALRSKPVHISLPNEVQGEAIAIEPDGTLLSASEGERQPVRAVRGAVALLPKPPPAARPAKPAKPDEPAAAPAHDADGKGKGQGLDTGPAILVAAGLTGLIVLGVNGIKRLRKR
jgi:hypothetical protein